MEPRVSIVTLCVTDLGASRRFYEALGFVRSAASQDGIAFYQAGGLVLALYPRASLAHENAGLSADGIGAFSGITLAHNARDRAGVDAVLAEVEAAGATILKPAEEVFWGGYSGYFADPDGFVWEVAHNPFLPVAEDGTPLLP